MEIAAINTIFPIDSRKKVTELTAFLSSCAPSDRLPIEDCVRLIRDVRLREIFFLKCLNQNLFPGKEDFIRNMQMLMFKKGKLVDPEDVPGGINAQLERAPVKDASRQKSSKKAGIREKKNRLFEDAFVIREMESYVFAKVKAKELSLQDGKIYYDKYTLHSVRVKRTSHAILSQIDHTFHLIKDIKLSSKTNGLRFHFWPYNDLSYLLGEIERLTEPKDVTYDNDMPQNGRFFLPWKYVVFFDGIMYLEHPHTSKRGTLSPFQYRHVNILKSYRDILPYIESRCPRFDVESKDGVITKVYNFAEFQKMIPHFYERAISIEEIDIIEKTPKSQVISKCDFLSDINRKRIKSPYLIHLSKRQVENRVIYYLLESVCHSSSEVRNNEYGYLFTIKECQGISLLVYENVTDESRSSLVFYIESENFAEGVEFIRTFLASDIKNKRMRLATDQIRWKNTSIIKVFRVIHNEYNSWLNQIDSFLSIAI